jgi:hypothetical protein
MLDEVEAKSGALPLLVAALRTLVSARLVL